MAESKTHYFIKDNHVDLLGHLRALYESNKNYDVVFQSSEKFELKAHKLVLLGCEFFRDLFDSMYADLSDELIRIVLPQYKFETINCLLKLLYTGDTFIPTHLMQEFIDICLEFNCDTIIDVENLVKAYKVENEPVPFNDEEVTDWLRNQSLNSRLEITKVDLPKNQHELMDMDDYFEVNRNVEAIYLDENNVLGGEEEFSSFSSRKIESDPESLENETTGYTRKSKKRRNYVEDDCDDEEIEKVERVSYRTPDGEGTNPLYDEQLKKACNDVLQNGISFLTASRKYGITRSVIHRHVQRLRQGKTSEDSPGPSVKEEEKIVSWWDKINPSWNVDPPPEECEQMSKKPKLKIKCKSEGSNAKNPKFLENLRLAVDDVVNNGLSFWTAHKKYGITRSVIHRHVQRIRREQEGQASKKRKPKKSEEMPLEEMISPQSCSSQQLSSAAPVNIVQLREELNKFKERLQKAINACRNDGVHVKKASKMFDVPAESIERNLKGFKRT